MIPYGRQDISQTDIDAVIDVLRSDFLTQGPAVPIFEKVVADYCGAKYALAVNSATSALHLACLALNIGVGDCVWTTPITFVASANCVLYCGATIDFVDIDSRTYNISVEHLKQKLSEAEKIGRLPKAIIPVHLCGQACDMSEIYLLSLQYGFRIIEDASHAIGGRYRGEAIGNCRYSDITVFSFHPVKIITTGEGGMAMTNDPRLAKRMQILRSHGITRDANEMSRDPDGQWYYEQIELGFNYRMTDIQAALGSSQMRRLDEFVSRRHEIASHYDVALTHLPVSTPWQHPDSYSGMHLYVIRLDNKKSALNQVKVFTMLHAAGVGVNLHYIPVYRQPYYERLGFRSGYCLEAERYYAEAISLPIYPAMTDAQQGKICKILSDILLRASI